MSTAEQTTQVAGPQTVAEMMQELARIKAENEALKAAGAKVVKPRHSIGHGLSLRVGEKGGIAIYGLNSRFPVTLYRSQFEKLAQSVPAILEFIKLNADKLVYTLEK